MTPTPNIMPSTSVYGFENEISQICALLKVLGYNVWNSHLPPLKPETTKINKHRKADVYERNQSDRV